MDFLFKNFLKRKKVFTFKEYFKISYPQYIYLKIIPVTSVRNYNSEVIAKAIASMYKPTYQRVKKGKSFHLTYSFPEKFSFIIDISLKNVCFYIVCPNHHEKLIREKILETWNKVTISKVDSIPGFSNEALKYQICYEKRESLSLKVDRKMNQPLNNILSVLEVLENKNDRVGIVYNFLPIAQEGWKIDHKNDMERVKKELPMEREILNLQYVAKYAALSIIKLIDFILDFIGDFLSNDTNSKNRLAAQESALSLITSESFKNLSKHSKGKGDCTVLNTQIMILSESEDNIRKENNAIAVCESFKVLNEDNSLIYKKIKRNVFYVNEFKIANVETNKMSTIECRSLLEIPGRELLLKYPHIERVDVLENPIPLELRTGYISLGKSRYRGCLYEAYLREEYNLGNLPLMILGPQGSGKTTFISNLVKNANNRGEAILLIDYIKNCELSREIERNVDEKDLMIIDLSKYDNLQGLGYTEVGVKEGATEFELLEMANKKTEQTLSFIDAVNVEGLPLSSKMRRFMSAAGNVVYLHQDKGIGEVIKCLQDYKIRHKYISYIKENLSEDSKAYFTDLINTLQELDEINVIVDPKTKKIIDREVVGTKDSKIEGILDRIELLKENIYLKYMLFKSCKDTINLVNAIEDGKVILVKLPEDKFNDTMTKNIITTYFTSKAILAIKLRGALHSRPKRCHLIYDELSQAPTSQNVLKKVLNQLRKFGGHTIISAHYLNQLKSDFKDELLASGTSFMMLQGCERQNFETLKYEADPYELNDLLNLKQHESLNLIRYEKGIATFITKLPEPLS